MTSELFTSTIFSGRFTNLDICEPAAKVTSLRCVQQLAFQLLFALKPLKKKKKSLMSFLSHGKKNLQFSVFRMTEIVQHTQTHTHLSVFGTHPERKISARVIKVWQSYR